MEFEWSEAKNAENIVKHGLSFYEAQDAFFDKSRVVLLDARHSSTEKDIFVSAKLPMAVSPQ